MAVGSATGLKIPDERYLAFAVCIVETTPRGLTIEDYIGLLRQHVAKSRRENALSAVHRHLDRSSYWQAEYERVRDALDSAEKEGLDLRLEIDRLKAKSDSGQSTNATKKRKKPDDPDVVPVPRSPKRPKQASSDKTGTLTSFNVDAGFNFAHLGESGDVLMRSFYQAHALLKSQSRTEPVLLAQQLVQAANAVSDVLQKLTKRESTDLGNDFDTMKPVLTAANRAVQSLLVGYGRISNVAGGNEVQGHIIYAYVQILETSISVMTEFAKAEVERADREALMHTGRPLTSKGKAKHGADPTFKQRKNPVLSTLSSFIAGNIELLDARMKSHKPLFEGLGYVLIEKLATCLYTLVFGRARHATITEDIAPCAQPDEIEEADPAPTTTPDEMNVRVAKLEAPYLIQPLTRLMQAAPAHLGASVTSKSGKAKGSSKQDPVKDNLAITAKERLQRTLVNCMFGEQDEDGEEDPFMDCLRKAAPRGSLPAMPAMKEGEVQEWFKEEVWRLLGWDILSSDGGW